MKLISLKPKDDFAETLALNGMTKKELSKAVGVTEGYFYRSKANIGIKTANKVAKVLHKKIGDIFFTVNIDKRTDRETSK